MRHTINRGIGFDNIVSICPSLGRFLLNIGFNCFLLLSVSVHSEIYRSVDSQGRVQFSDRPVKQYDSAGYSHPVSNNHSDLDNNVRSPDDLNEIAKKLKEDRLKRKKLRDKAHKVKNSNNKKQKKKIAAAKRKKLACKKAREKEDIAFRKRTQRQGLVKMRKALDNYHKKREIRRAKCND